MTQPFILGIGGTLRRGSTSEKALHVSLHAAELCGARVTALTGEDLNIPLYSQDSAVRPQAAARLVRLMRACDGIIVSTPSYHGGISGMIKNALDYTEDMRGDERPYFDGIGFGSIVCAAGWQGVGVTATSLRSVAHALRAWPTPMSAGINSLANPFDAAGDCTDESVRFQLETVGRQVAELALRNAGSAARSQQRGEQPHRAAMPLAECATS